MPQPAMPSAALPGSTLSLRMHAAQDLARPAVAFAIPPRTMLLVEDSRLAAEAVRLICRRVGIRLRRAESLAAAAMHLRVYRPDIALIDLGLPDGSGLDLIRALAASPLRPRRLVAVSGDPDLAEAARNAGADAFLQKPVSLARHLAMMTGEPAAAEARSGWTSRAGWDAEDDGSGEEDSAADEDWYWAADGTEAYKGSGWTGGAPRNAGADPLALRDDLRRVHELLSDTAGPSRLHYAGQFLSSVGRALQDPVMAKAAEAAAEAGDRHMLVALAESRARRTPVI